MGGLDSDDMRKLFSQTDNYLETWQPALANNRDKYIFLEHCVLKILWEPQNKLSAHVLEVLDWLKENLSIDISESAGLVQKLYEDYNKKKIRIMETDTRNWKPGTYIALLKLNGKIKDSFKFTLTD